MNEGKFVRWSAIALRWALAASFLSAIGDRLGFLGMHNYFVAYADQLTWSVPPEFRAAVTAISTVAQLLVAMALVTGFRIRIAAFASGALLLTFGLAMTMSAGPSAPLDYSVFTAAAASLFLAAFSAPPKVVRYRRKLIVMPSRTALARASFPAPAFETEAVVTITRHSRERENCYQLTS
jgi:uncharacterized membrane protein YphA (DoxX/SURF4 family)